jgi:hypothetical protein
MTDSWFFLKIFVGFLFPQNFSLISQKQGFLSWAIISSSVGDPRNKPAPARNKVTTVPDQATIQPVFRLPGGAEQLPSSELSYKKILLNFCISHLNFWSLP